MKLATVVAWHKRRFRFHWRRKSRPHGGRPSVPRDVRDLIRQMARANPLWGAPRIHGELLKLGIEIAQSTVSKYLPRRTRPRPGNQSWMTFLRNHAEAIVAVDLFVVPTVTFRLLYGIVVIAHDRRRLLHVNVTQFPNARWAAQQIVEAFAFVQPTRFLLRDRDGIYGKVFRQRIASLGMEELLSAPRSPWQNPIAECVIGSLRRELLDHVIVLNEAHLYRLLSDYRDYYYRGRMLFDAVVQYFEALSVPPTNPSTPIPERQ